MSSAGLPLNDAQLEAVNHDDGPLLVVAGPGSGKTMVVTHRIARLLREGLAEPKDVLAITFTNRAANEMRSRVSDLVGDDCNRMWVRTFHSMCAAILRIESHLIGFQPNFSIYDTNDTENLLYALLGGDESSTLKPRALRSLISWLKNKDCPPPGEGEEKLERLLEEYGANSPPDFVADIYGRYQTRLHAANALDFDDLLLGTRNVLLKSEQARSRWQSRFRYVLVDEYQDTNTVQAEIVEMLGEKHRQVCVVGDPDQSIYAFRAADINNILNFSKAFPETKEVLLEQNYRSTISILRASDNLISHNVGRIPKTMRTEKEDGPPVILSECMDDFDGAHIVEHWIEGLRDEHGLAWSDIAVLYRTKRQSRSLEEVFRYSGVPHRVIGGQPFYSRREVKDAIAWLRCLQNPEDAVSIRRTMRLVKGIGQKTVNLLSNVAETEHGGLMLAAVRAGRPAGLRQQYWAGVQKWLRCYEDAADHTAEGAPPADVAGRVLNRCGYVEYLHDINETERLNNLDELIEVMESHSTIEEFLGHVELLTDEDDRTEAVDVVSLMTLHASKGTEFEGVAIVGFHDGLLPHFRALESNNLSEVEEERRLAYVGMTRAKKHLHLLAEAEKQQVFFHEVV